MKKLSIFLFVLTFAHFSQAQVRSYLVRFTDKSGSTFSVNRPLEFLSQRAVDRRTKQNIRILERDLPVNQAYTTQLRQAGAKVVYTSRWLNGALIEADPTTLTKVNQLTFIRKDNTTRLNSINSKDEKEIIDTQEPSLANGKIEENYGTSFQQFGMIGVDKMHDDGFKGENMHIAVIDGGFTNANTNLIFRQTKIIDAYNFPRNTTDVYNNITDTHGTRVLSLLAAFQDGQLIGAAYKASFYLFTTENDNANIENKVEEANWIFAAERADSLGVDIITTSLGYTTFDDSSLNYTINDLDGKTALISQAAAVAVRTGMIVVKSAGNAGSSAWQKVSFPGDVDSVLTVGSVDANSVYVSSSSRGKTTDGRIKPDVVGMGRNTVVGLPLGNISVATGTSFAAPQIAGLAAGLWQANPSMTNMQIVNMIRRSGTRFASPSDSIGYGIPSYTRAKILANNSRNFDKNNIVIYPNHMTSNLLQIWFDEQYLGRNITLALSDVLGKTYFVENTKLQDINYQLDISKYHLTSGLYFLQISSQGLTKIVKVMK